MLVPLPCAAAGEGASGLHAAEDFRAGYAAGVRSKRAGVLCTAGPCHATQMTQPQPWPTIWPHRWLLPAVPQVAFATVIPSAFIVSGRGKGLVGGQVVAPECGATLGCRYLMPHVAFSVAIVAK